MSTSQALTRVGVVLAVLSAGRLAHAAPAKPAGKPAAVPVVAASTAPHVVYIKDANFRVTLPAGWQITRQGQTTDKSGYLLHGGSPDRQVRVRVRAKKLKNPAKAEIKKALEYWEKKVLDMQVVRYKRLSETPMDVGAHAGLAAFYLADMPRKSSIQTYRITTNVFLTKDGWVYIVSGYVQEKFFEQRKKELFGVIGSFDIVGGAIAVKADPKAKPVQIKPYKAKMRRVFDAAGKWELEIPEHYTLADLKKVVDAKKNERFRARITSPGKNVRIFITTREHKDKTFDFKGRFARYTKSLVARKRFENLAQVPNAGGQIKNDLLDVQWESFEGIARRKVNSQLYRVIVLLAHAKPMNWTYTLAISLQASDYVKNAGIIQELIDSFAPFDPAAQAAEGTQQAAGAKKAGGK